MVGGGGSYLIDGNWVNIPGQYHVAIAGDAGNDGIPDSLDAYPTDANNGNSTAQYTWNGGSYWINGVWTTLQAGTFTGTWSDIDGDGIPDAADPYPSDFNNNTAWWSGGSFLIDG